MKAERKGDPTLHSHGSRPSANNGITERACYNTDAGLQPQDFEIRAAGVELRICISGSEVMLALPA